MEKNLLQLLVTIMTASFVGHLVIEPIINSLRKRINDNPPYTFLAGYVGMADRALYVLALGLGYPSFIGIWLVFKVASKWSRWYGDKPANDKSEDEKGRARFQIFLLGNSLSILFAVVIVIISKSLWK